MDVFFKKLQEVADLPNSPQPHGSPGESDATINERPVEHVNENSSRSELIHALRFADSEKKAAEKRIAEITKEATDIADEYAAYKLKVSSWREQIKQARAQDRKTIETLKEAAARTSAENNQANSMVGGSGASITESMVPASYATTLEEQVRVQKETIRDQAQQRDILQLELTRLKEKQRKEVLEASERTGENSEGDAQLIKQLRSEIVDLQRRFDDSEKMKEKLRIEVDDAHTTLTDAISKHEQEVASLKSQLSSDAKATYIKDLEAELNSYRKRVESLELEKAEMSAIQAATVHASNDVIVDRENGGTDSATSQEKANTKEFNNQSESVAAGSIQKFRTQLEQYERELSQARQEIERLKNTNKGQQKTIDELREANAALSAECAIRDDNLSEMYGEARDVRGEVAVLSQKLQKLSEDVASAKLETDTQKELVEERDTLITELESRGKETASQLARALHDLAAKCDEVRSMKLEEARRKVEAAAAGAAATVVANSIPKIVTSGTPPPTPIMPVEFRHRSHREIFENSIHFARSVWASNRLRWYAIVSVLVLLTMLFSFSQAAVLAQDEATTEFLKKCKDLLGKK